MGKARRKNGERISAYRILVGKPEGIIGRNRRIWEINSKIYLPEVDCWACGWIDFVEDEASWRSLLSAVMNLRVPYNAKNILTSCEPVRFS
jgi:hypothetical protein